MLQHLPFVPLDSWSKTVTRLILMMLFSLTLGLLVVSSLHPTRQPATVITSLAQLSKELCGAALGANSPFAVVAQAKAAFQIQPPPLSFTYTGSLWRVVTTGTTQSYTHVFTNNAPTSMPPQTPLTINFKVVSRQGWTTSINPTTLTLNPGQSGSIVVQTTIPTDTWAGTMGLTTISATNIALPTPFAFLIHDTMLIETDKSLAIPSLQYGQLTSGQRVYTLTPAASTTEFVPGVKTPTWGYNGASFLGPTLIMTTGEMISITVTNNLTEMTTVHWHGLHLPGKMDGGPHQPIAVGAIWQPTFMLYNHASTPWYHPHPHPHEHEGGGTGVQVHRGLAGMIIIRDAESANLSLPKTYGVDEFPIVLQERNINPDGTFREYPVLQDKELRKGDYFMVNGTLGATLEVPAQMIRLHLLDGANARFYNLGMSDNRNFQQIGADDALLNNPISRKRMVIAPGERIEAVLDLSDAEGKTIYLMNYAGEWGDFIIPNHVADDYDRANYPLLALRVVAPTANAVKSLSTTLNNIPVVDASKAVVTRTLLLNVPPSINGGVFDMETINYTATLGTQEIWTFFNASDETHPMHIHDTPFRIISRNGQPPEAHEAGWKDTVLVRSGDTVKVLKDFPRYPDPDSPYVYHCHILEHEDHGMMGQYIIVEAAVKSTYLPVIRR